MKLLKSLIAAAAIATAATGAFADPVFSITGGTETNYVGIGFNPLPAAEFGGSFWKQATLNLSEAGQVTFSFYNKNAGFNNSFQAFYVGSTLITGNGGLSQSFTVNVGAGALNFAYLSNGVGTPVGNGSLGMGADVSSTDASHALIHFNDSWAGDSDFDDLTISAVAAVPEVETYAMLLAGLGLVGTIARRRNKSKAA